MNIRRIGLVAATMLLGACGPTGPGVHFTASRTGAAYPSRPTSCALYWERAGDEQARAKYEVIGKVAYTGRPVAAELDRELWKKVQAEACAMGGDAVILDVATDSGGAKKDLSMASYTVLKARAASRPSAANATNAPAKKPLLATPAK